MKWIKFFSPKNVNVRDIPMNDKNLKRTSCNVTICTDYVSKDQAEIQAALKRVSKIVSSSHQRRMRERKTA